MLERLIFFTGGEDGSRASGSSALRFFEEFKGKGGLDGKGLAKVK